jgi:hypothetical protein
MEADFFKVAIENNHDYVYFLALTTVGITAVRTDTPSTPVYHILDNAV